MEAVMSLISSNLVQLASNLSQITPGSGRQGFSRVEVVVVPFVDTPASIRGTQVGSPQVAAQTLQTLTTIEDPSNEDGPEIGLLAFEQTLQNISKLGANADSIDVVLVVTDNFSHRSGDILARDWNPTNVGPLISAIQSPNVFIYDSSPQFQPPDPYLDGAAQQPPYSTPADQWQQVRQIAAQAKGQTNVKGRSLGFPMNANAMLQLLPSDLQGSIKFCQ